MVDLKSKAYTFDKVALLPQFSDFFSRLEPDISTYFCRDVASKIPIIPANMDCIATPEMGKVIRALGGVFIHHRHQELAHIVGGDFYTVGMRGFSDNRKEWERHIAAVIEAGANIVFDIAHAHNISCLEASEWLKRHYPDISLLVGNLGTGIAAHDFCKLFHNVGVDGVKVSIGPGDPCQTKNVTGVYVPGLTATALCYDVTKRFKNVTICCDGGIKSAGDMVKAFAAGADTVMIGSLLAGTIEAGGSFKLVVGHKEEYFYDSQEEAIASQRLMGGKIYRCYWGQSSQAFQEKWYGAMKKGIASEGSVKWVEFSNKSAKDVILDYCAGIRSGCTYLGASSLGKIRNKAEFIEIA